MWKFPWIRSRRYHRNTATPPTETSFPQTKFFGNGSFLRILSRQILLPLKSQQRRDHRSPDTGQAADGRTGCRRPPPPAPTQPQGTKAHGLPTPTPLNPACSPGSPCKLPEVRLPNAVFRCNAAPRTRTSRPSFIAAGGYRSCKAHFQAVPPPPAPK